MADPQPLVVRNDLVPQSPLPVFNIIIMFYKVGVGESRWLDTVAEASQPLLPFATWFVTPCGLVGPDYHTVNLSGSLSLFVRLLLWNLKDPGLDDLESYHQIILYWSRMLLSICLLPWFIHCCKPIIHWAWWNIWCLSVCSPVLELRGEDIDSWWSCG